MKQVLFTVCIIGSVFLTGGAIAQDVKPGQRMIYDDRAPKDPSGLDKPIFNKPIIAPKQTRTEPDENEEPEAQENTERQPDGEADSDDASTNVDDGSPPVYVTPEDEGESDSDTDVLGLKDISAQDQRQLRNMTEDIMENMPHKNLDLEQMQNLSPEDQERMLKELKQYTNKHGKKIREEIAE